MKKKIIVLILLTLMPLLTWAQIEGLWKGKIEIQNNALEMFINIKKNNETFSATLSIPAQSANDLAFDEVLFNEENNSVTLTMNMIGASYSGQIGNDGSIEGYFNQGGYELPLNLVKTNQAEMDSSSPHRDRPQTPRPPYNYNEEEVSFKNKNDDITIAGTLTIPENYNRNTPVVILFNGSGQQNRNSEIYGHQPFWVIADYLSSKGVVVLRYDDRGIGGTSAGGHLNEATTYDFARDGQAAIDFIKGRGFKNIHLLGHSEGGVIASILGADNKDLKSLILFASNAVIGSTILEEQVYYGGIASGVHESVAQANKELIHFVLKEMRTDTNISQSDLKNKIISYTGQQAVFTTMSHEEKESLAQTLINTYSNNWMRTFSSLNPADYLGKVKYPVLVIYGGKDYQVPASLNHGPMKKILKNKKSQVVIFPDLNHLLQTSGSGAATEYAEIEETISPQVLEKLFQWLNL